METEEDVQIEKKSETWFKIKTFLLYLIIEPFTTSISMPNLRTVTWILLLVAIYFKETIFIFILLILALILHLFSELQSKKYIDWYRSRKYSASKQALKKIRMERKVKENETI